MNAQERIMRFDQTGDLRDLEAGIAAYRELTARDPDPLLLADLANALSRRYGELHQEADIEQAIALHRRAVAALAGQPEMASAQAQLAFVLGNHVRPGTSDLTEVLGLYATALRGQLPDRPLMLANYGMFLQSAFYSTGELAHLIASADALRESVSATDPASDKHVWRMAKLGSTLVPLAGDPERAAELKAVVRAVRERYDEVSEVLKREIQLLLLAAWNPDAIDEIPPEGWELLQNPKAMEERFKRLPSDVFANPGGRSMRLAFAGALHLEDARRSGRLDRADHAVDLYRQAVTWAPEDTPQVGSFLGGLGAALGLRMEFSGTVGDLDEMIVVLGRAVAIIPPGDTEKAMCRSNLGNGLMLRFKVDGGDPRVLDEAIATFRRALQELPEDSDRANAFTSLGSALSSRFELTGNLADLDQCVDSHRAAVSATTRDHPNYAMYRGNLGSALQQRFRVTRRDTDADQAVDALREAVTATEETSPYWPTYVGNLGALLTDRYLFSGQSAALAEAIEILRAASQAIHPGNVMRAGLLNSLGLALAQGDGYEDEAVRAFRDARSAAPPGSYIRTLATVNLGGQLANRAAGSPAALAAVLAGAAREPVGRRQLRDLLPRGQRAEAEIPDLEEAIALLEEAVRMPPWSGSIAYAQLGVVLRMRYLLTRRPRALARALRSLRAAVSAVPSGAPEASIARLYFAQALTDQWELTHEAAARDEALACYRAAAEVDTASAGWRATIARRWGEFAMGEGLPAEAADGFATAIGMLDEAAWRGLGRPDQERVLRDYEGIARDAAAAAIRAGDARRALELLEQGRGVMLAQVLDSQSPRDRVHDASPELAARLGEIQDALDRAEALDVSGLAGGIGAGGVGTGPTSTGGADAGDVDWSRFLDLRYSLARQRREVLAQIRRLPGLADFLLPPSSQALLTAAEDGPVIVANVSQYGCDALIVTPTGMRVLPLHCTAAEADQQARLLVAAVSAKAIHGVSACLDWTWDNVTGPVLDTLEALDALGSARRIWWCPTGPLTLVPMHAAGPALDRVVSSYTPTLRALLHARTKADGPEAERQILLVGDPRTPGEPPLSGAASELAAVRQCIPSAGELTGADATHGRVLAALEGSALAHFACHAAQELDDPSLGRLILHDRPLTVRELAALRLGQAELAYLSGCDTSRGGTALTDEAVSLAASVHLAGFPHVIGTLWPVSDIHAPHVAEEVYAVLTAAGTREPRPDAAAIALHGAVRSLRRQRPGFPIFWAPYVHVGP
jgi:tetratricopeptide (TPR) repeat protein